MIIDSHVHISYIKQKRKFLDIKKELLLSMQENRVNRAIIIPDNVPNSNCCDLDTLVPLIKNDRNLFMLGTLKVSKVTKVNIYKINNLFKKRLIYGFKIFPGHDPVFPTDKRWIPIYKLCIRHKYPLVIHTGINSDNKRSAKYNNPKYITKIAKLYPELKIIISHYFWPKLDYCFLETNGFKNIYFDTSGLADSEVVRISGGIKKIKDILIKTIRRDRQSVIFGSDWPMTNIKQHIQLINSLSLTKEEKKDIFFRNAQRVFRVI